MPKIKILGNGQYLDANTGKPVDQLGNPIKTASAVKVTASPKTTTSTLPSANTYQPNIYAVQADYDQNIGKYPWMQLYNPKTTQLKAGDIFLGGAGGTGVTDYMLNGAKRLYGADRTATAKALEDYMSGYNTLAGQNQDILSRLNTAQKTAKAATSENPIQALIGDDPEMQAIYDQAKQAAKVGSQNAMEELNARGILNSTITSDRLGQIASDSQTNVLAQLYEVDRQKRQQAINDAYSRTNMLGYVDNAASQVLGLPVGTPSQTARQYQFENELAQKNYALDEGQVMGTYNGQPTLEAQKLAQQQAQDEWTKQYQLMGFNADQAYRLAQLDLQKAEIAQNAAYRNASLGLEQQKFNQQLSSSQIDDLIQNLNSLYLVKDQYSGAITVNPDTVSQLRMAILRQNLSDEDTDKLLSYYGLPTN